MMMQEKILSAAREFVFERSVDDLTIVEVARRAGVSRQTVYEHVGGVGKLKDMIRREIARAPEGDHDTDTRTRLLAAARRVFAQYGYERSTLDQVAADAGLSKGAVYWHFASKSDLFMALMEEQFRRHQAIAMHSIGAVSSRSNPIEAVAAIVRDQLLACQADPEWAQLWLEFLCQRRDPDSRSRLAEFHRSARLVQAEVIRRLQAEGGLPAGVDPATLAVLFDTLSTGMMVAWLIDPDNITPADWGPNMVRLLWQGLGAGNS